MTKARLWHIFWKSMPQYSHNCWLYSMLHCLWDILSYYLLLLSYTDMWRWDKRIWEAGEFHFVTAVNREEQQRKLEREWEKDRQGDGCVCICVKLDARVIPITGSHKSNLLHLLQNTARATTLTLTRVKKRMLGLCVSACACLYVHVQKLASIALQWILSKPHCYTPFTVCTCTHWQHTRSHLCCPQ